MHIPQLGGHDPEAGSGGRESSGCSNWTWKGCLGCALAVKLGPSVLMSPTLSEKRKDESPSTVIPDCPLLELAVAGWGPREAGRKLMSWAPGEVELLRVLQGMLQLEWPLQWRPEGWALFVSHCNAPE